MIWLLESVEQELVVKIMPMRTPQHENGDTATTSVKLIWNKIGAAAEEIRQDYGDDLLVQTHLSDGRMDASRLWVQVKGRKDINEKSGKYNISVSADTVLRWVRTADVLVLVLWDTPRDRGWYMLPSADTLHSELSRKRGEDISLPIELSTTTVFDADAAASLAWWSRLHHLARFIRSFRYLEAEQKAWGNRERAAWAHDAYTAATIDGLTDLKIAKRVGNDTLTITEDFHEMVKWQAAKVIYDRAVERDTGERGKKGKGGKQGKKNREMNELLRTIAARSVVSMIAEVSGLKTDLSLLDVMVDMVMVLLKAHMKSGHGMPDFSQEGPVTINYPSHIRSQRMAKG